MYNKIVRMLCGVMAALVLQLSLAGCNTIRGAGQDIEAAGGAVEKKAEEKKSY